VLLDLGLPGKDGRELLEELRHSETLRQIPVVVMTASTDQQDLVQSENLSVEAYLVKPVDLGKFIDVVSNLKRFWKEDMVLPTVSTTDDTEEAEDRPADAVDSW
jgi:DNA-binding response OmpR family regulator